jgi:hypothetical protein
MSAITTGVDRTAGNGPIVFRANDGNEQTSANPIQIPVAGTDYSFTKQMRANVTVAPATQLENLVCYSDGTNNFGTGIGVEYDINATFQAQIDTTITGADYFGLNSGAPGDLGAGPHSGTGYKGDLLRLQMTVASTASPGQTPVDEALTFAYDES